MKSKGKPARLRPEVVRHARVERQVRNRRLHAAEDRWAFAAAFWAWSGWKLNALHPTRR